MVEKVKVFKDSKSFDDKQFHQVTLEELLSAAKQYEKEEKNK